jgi:hypothetical protein
MGSFVVMKRKRDRPFAEIPSPNAQFGCIRRAFTNVPELPSAAIGGFKSDLQAYQR